MQLLPIKTLEILLNVEYIVFIAVLALVWGLGWRSG